MSYDHPIELIDNDVLIVSVLGADGSYFMWQKCLTEEVGSKDGIYFEFNDQINGGHNLVTECSVTSEGIQVVLSNSSLENFFFPPGFDKFQELKAGLNNVYAGKNDILEIRI